jgi:multisubunit Na+/H+ antiporter MnhB subunit
LEVLETLPGFGTPAFAAAAEDPNLPDPAAQDYIENGLAKTGAANLVASVILDFRAYDTLGEATVLFTSIVGAMVILRKKPKKLLEDPDE